MVREDRDSREGKERASQQDVQVIGLAVNGPRPKEMMKMEDEGERG